MRMQTMEYEDFLDLARKRRSIRRFRPDRFRAMH